MPQRGNELLNCSSDAKEARSTVRLVLLKMLPVLAGKSVEWRHLSQTIQCGTFLAVAFLISTAGLGNTCMLWCIDSDSRRLAYIIQYSAELM